MAGERKGRKWRALRRNGAETGDSDGQWATPLTERKLEPEEIVGGQPLPARSLQVRTTVVRTAWGRRTKEETN